MLSKQQAVYGVQLDIEGVAARRSHLVRCAKHSVIIVRLRRGIDLCDRARPGHGLVGTGADGHGQTGIELIQVQLVDLALDAVGAALDHGDVRKRLTGHIVVAAVFIDRVDLAADRRSDRAAAAIALQVCQLSFLDGDVVLHLLFIRLQRLDMDGIGELFRLRCALLFLFKLRNLLGIVLDGVLHLFDLQLCLVDGKLDLVGVIDEQYLALGDSLSDLDLQLRDLAVFVPFDLDLFLCNDDSGAGVAAPHRAVAHDLRDGLDIDGRELIPAAGQSAEQQRQRHSAGKQSFFHVITSVVNSSLEKTHF